MVLRVYWPKDVINNERKIGPRPAIIIGWNNNDSDFLVVTTLPYLDPIVVDKLLQEDKLLKSALSPSSSKSKQKQKSKYLSSSSRSSSKSRSPIPSPSPSYANLAAFFSSASSSSSSGSSSATTSASSLGSRNLPQLTVLGTVNVHDLSNTKFSGNNRYYINAHLSPNSPYPSHSIHYYVHTNNGNAAARLRHRKKHSRNSSWNGSGSATHDTKVHYSGIDAGTSFSDTYIPYDANGARTGRNDSLNGSSDSSFQVILFDPPASRRMQYFSIYPIGLALAEKSNTLTVIDEEYEKFLVENANVQQILRQNALQHTLRNRSRSLVHGVVLSACIHQMNSCCDLGALLRTNADVLFPKLIASGVSSVPAFSSSSTSSRSRRPRSMSETMVQSARSVQQNFWSLLVSLSHYVRYSLLLPYVARIFVFVIICGRLLAEAILRLVEWNFVPMFALKDGSATAQQVDLRLLQFCFWPIQYARVRQRLKFSSTHGYATSGANIAAGNIEYVRFYNSIWLVANDIILGVSVCTYVKDNLDAIVSWLDWFVDSVLTHQLRSSILWLMGWPAGLKLNNELAVFFGELFLWVIEFWSQILLLIVRTFGRSLVLMLAYSGFLGITFTISAVCDLVSFFTLHIYACYLASARMYRHQLLSLHSLSLLFRGKKRNVLRNRIDSCNYDLDQLLMGTLLFMVQLFLLPTVAVFYSFFAFCRLSIVLGCGCLESILACLNHFPLFAILLRIKDPRRIPGGIELKVVDKKFTREEKYESLTTSPGRESCVELRSVPLAYSHMFEAYRTLGQRLHMHYLTFGVVTRILTGQFVPIRRSKLYGLLYSMLPEHRVTIPTLIDELRKWC